jgi:hypothetical protein
MYRAGISSVSSEDSLPLGCDAQQMAVLKLSKDLKSKYRRGSDSASAVREENDADGKSVRLCDGSPDFVLRNLPCVRFYLEGPDVQNSEATDYVRQLLRADDSSKVCMLRMQEPLVCTETDPGRSFKCTLSRDCTFAVGVTAEGRNKVGALPKRFQVPSRVEKLRVVLVRGKRGDMFSLSTSPAVSYHVAKSAGAAKTMRGEMTCYRNEQAMSLEEVLGPPDVESMPLLHDFSVLDGICGIAFWVGGLTDVVEGH